MTIGVDSPWKVIGEPWRLIGRIHNECVATQPATLPIAITASLTTTAKIDFRGFAGGMIYVPTGSSITTLTPYCCPYENGTFLPIKDMDRTTKTITVDAAFVQELESYLFAAHWLKFVGNAAGDVTFMFKG